MVEMTKEQQGFYTEFMDSMKQLTAKYPSVTNADCVIIMGRAVGMCMAASGRDDQKLLMEMLMRNIDAVVGPTPGVQYVKVMD